jgi:hypothetical protein
LGLRRKPHEFWALRLENDENQRRFHLDLEILAQIFHAFHCLQDNGLAGTSEFLLAKVSILQLPVASSPDSAFFSFPLIPAFSVKKTSDLRQAKFCPICVRASQQLVPHFMILALSLNPVHEYSELI